MSALKCRMWHILTHFCSVNTKLPDSNLPDHGNPGVLSIGTLMCHMERFETSNSMEATSLDVCYAMHGRLLTN